MESSLSVFARLTPSNTAAKLAFDAAYELLSKSGVHGLSVEPQQQYDKDVLLWRLEQAKKERDDFNDSASPTDIDSGTESLLKDEGMIWSGWYSFDLGTPPSDATRGWTAGTGTRAIEIDFLMKPQVMNPRKEKPNVHGYHARFYFHAETGHLYLSKISRRSNAEVEVNGNSVACGEQYVLNQNPMNIRIGALAYEFRYTEFASTNHFYKERQQYMTETMGVSRPPDINLTPTPAETSRTLGAWSILKPLGRGAQGRVFSASNTKGEIVAIKIVERSRKTISQVNSEIQVLEELQKLSEIHEGDRKRVLRLREAIFQGAENHISTSFDEVALVLEPAVTATFWQITGPVANLRSDKDPIKNIKLFHDALLGLNFLHAHNWIHGDCKPDNIGIVDGTPPRAVLLDLGGALHLQPGTSRPPTAGHGGTIWYLAPERELQAYDSSVDVWSMGVIGYEIAHGYHPWKLARNPWRPGPEYESLQPTFQGMYRSAVEVLTRDKDTQFNDLLLQMPRHPWAIGNSTAPRITTRDVLNHPCWQQFLDDDDDDDETGGAPPPAKRSKPIIS